jgi:hypothetical protein
MSFIADRLHNLPTTQRKAFRQPAVKDFLDTGCFNLRWAIFDYDEGQIQCKLIARNRRNAQITTLHRAPCDGEAFHGALAKMAAEDVNILPGWPPAEVQRWLASCGFVEPKP